jgi:hypothetical protein
MWYFRRVFIDNLIHLGVYVLLSYIFFERELWEVVSSVPIGALILPFIYFNSAAAYKSILSFTCIFKTHLATFDEASSGMHSYPKGLLVILLKLPWVGSIFAVDSRGEFNGTI